VHRAEPASGDNGQRAIEKFNELNPDVVILDGQMPVMGGPERQGGLL
jgi:chemotaxis response regulator CheB